MSQEFQNITQIQVENVPELQHIQFAEGLPEGATVTFIDSSALDQQQIIDLPPGIEIYQTIQLQDGSEHVLQPLLTQLANSSIQVQTSVPEGEVIPPVNIEPLAEIPEPVSAPKAEEIRPPVGKGPFNCEYCDKIFKKWNQLQRHIKTHDDDKPFQCSSCTASFNVEDNLILHEATHVGENKDPICPECGKKFSRVASLKAHIMLHEKEENLMCPECGDEFGLQSQLDRHMQEHRQEHVGVRVFPCRQCHQEFTKLSLLRQHMKQHYKVRASLSHRTYKRDIDRSSFSNRCKHCNKHFQKPSQLQRHERIHTGERPFKCDECDRTFNQKGALQIHKTKHSGKKPHTCDFCPSAFSQRGNLRAHIQRVHTLSKDSEGPTYECGECSCMFKKLGSLNAHVSRAHSDPADEWSNMYNDNANDRPSKELKEAKVIEQLFDTSDKTQLQQPILQQQPAIDYQIDTTTSEVESNNNQTVTPNKSVETLDESTSDILQQALENSGLPNKGDGTEQQPSNTVGTNPAPTVQSTLSLPLPPTATAVDTSSSITTMTIHDTATGIVKRHLIRKVNGVRWHQCNYCSKEFKKPSDLVRHIRIHTHEKPYKCTQCFRSFAVKSTLTAHIKTHTGVKDYRCDQCRKLFSTQGSLKVHLRLHTGAKPFSCTHCDKKFRTSAHRKSHIQCHVRGEYVPGMVDRRPRRTIKRPPRLSDANLPEIPLQEPILITDTGFIQQPPRNNMVTQYLGEAASVDRPYKCNYCQRGFKKSSHLKQHVRSHTGEKPYRCGQCSRSFVSSGVLKAHLRTHSGVKSYRCIICETMFTTNGSLKRHMSTHSEVRPFMCPYCQKTFKTSVNCKKHMKTHKHELALQAMNPDPNTQHVQQDDVTLAPDGTQIDQSQASTDISLLQQQSVGHTTTIVNQDLNPAQLQEALVGAGLDPNLHPTLHSQVFGQQQQSFGEAMLSSQPTYTSLGNQLQVDPQLSSSLNNSLAQQLTNQHDLNNHMTNVTNQNELSGHVTNMNNSHDLTGHVTNITNQHELNNHMNNLTNQHEYNGQVTNITNQMTDQLNQEMNIHQIQNQQYNNNSLQIHPSTHRNILFNLEEQDQNEPPQQILQEVETDDQPQEIPDTSVLLTEDKTRSYQCGYCEKSFKKSGHLKQHIRTHTGEKPYRCLQCDRTFVSSGVLKAHAKTHTGSKDYKCPICNALFSTNGSLSRHMVIHDNPSVLTVSCPYCMESFRNISQCKRHMRSVHKSHKDKQNENDVPVVETPSSTIEPETTTIIQVQNDQTTELSKVTVEELSLSEKILMVSSVEKDRISEVKSIMHVDDSDINSADSKHAYKCTHCVKSFKKPSDLQRHVRTHTGEKPYTCDICNRSFTVKSTLASHIKTHGNCDKVFKCHICESLFSTKGSLKVHMRLHTGARPFKCPHCDHRFRTSGHRKSHILSHFKDPNTQTKKRKTFTRHLDPDEEEIGQQQVEEQTLGNQVLTLDPSMLTQQNVMPVSLTVADGVGGNIGESALAAQFLQGVDGIQLHFTGNLGQGMQLDPNMLSQTVQIDANLLQQLQQQGNINITINPNMINQSLTPTADPNLVQNIQVQQQVSLSEAVNPNILIPPNMVMSQSEMTSDNNNVSNVDEITVDPLDVQDPVIPDESEEMDMEDPDEDGGGDLNEDLTTQADMVSHDESLISSEMVTNMAAGDSAEIGMEKNFDPERLHVCSICGKGFKRAGHLKDHLSTHGISPKQLKDRLHKCSTCEKSFEKPSQLARHNRIHSGERPFVCGICQKAFNQKNTLQIHLRRHSDVRPHSCSYCGRSFLQKGNLKTHIKRAHHVDMVQSMILPPGVTPATMSNEIVMTSDPVTMESNTVTLTTSEAAEPTDSGMDMAELFDN